MVFKKSFYPKTARISDSVKTVDITEKIDGSNLGFGRLGGKLLVMQRNSAYFAEDLLNGSIPRIEYKGLFGWLEKHGEELLNSLHEGSACFGEWLGMGHIDYSKRFAGCRFLIFAKANFTSEDAETAELKNIVRKRNVIHYCFKQETNEVVLPSFIQMVPLVAVVKVGELSVHYLDELYEKYCLITDSGVEGFIVEVDNSIKKYVRLKSGKLEPHKE